MDIEEWERLRNMVIKAIDEDDNKQNVFYQNARNLIASHVALYPKVAQQVVSRVSELHPIPEARIPVVLKALTSDMPIQYNVFGQALKN